MKEDSDEIKIGLHEKLDAMERNQLYTKYKIAKSEEEKEQAMKKYLDKRGISESFRW